jgi:Family of unknown function (DUF695)/Regulator of ribonuclease activity B
MMKYALAFGLLFLGWSFGAVAQQKGATYQPVWEAYFAQHGDTLVSTVVDLGLYPFAPERSMPYHIRLALTLQDTARDGFTSKAEAPAIEKVQNNITGIFDNTGGILRVGVATANGTRTLHFYSRRARVDTALLNTAFIFYPQYRGYRLTINQDSTWSYYRTQLYPDARERQKIQNTRNIKDLVLNGDRLTYTRPVDHFILFASEKDAKAFAKKVKKEAFVQVSLEQDTASAVAGKIWALRLSRVDAVSPVAVDAYTLKLWELAPSYNGAYQGWQTVVVKRESPTVPR